MFTAPYLRGEVRALHHDPARRFVTFSGGACRSPRRHLTWWFAL